MSETWYRVTDYSTDIETVEAERSTDNTLYLKDNRSKEYRRNKSTSWENYFPSRELAKNYLVTLYKRRVNDALEAAERDRAKLKIVEAL